MAINILNPDDVPMSASSSDQHAAVNAVIVKDTKVGLPKRNDLNPVLKIEVVALEDIHPAESRVRKSNHEHTMRVRRSIETFGVRGFPLLTGSHEIIDGHTLVEAAKSLGLPSLKCVIADDLSKVELHALRITLNRCQERGDWDLLKLKEDFVFLEEEGVDLTVTAFEISEIDKIVLLEDGVSDESDDVEQIPAPEPVEVTRPGDLWTMRSHRLFCGNARDPDDLKTLIGGQTVSAVFTDHPFNVPISGHVTVGKGKHPEFAEASGEMSDDEYEEFLRITTANIADAIKPGGVLFLCIDWRQAEVLMRVVRVLGLAFLNVAVWAKHQPGMGSLYRSQHEFVLVVKRPGAPHQNNVQLGKHGRNRSNLWSYAGASGGKSTALDNFTLHPTVKPVKLVRDAILDVTSPGDVVLDPFVGSGSTLLAAELCRRVCFGSDISPAYVDVAVRRWEELTGMDAIHAETGLTFKAMKEVRAKQGHQSGFQTDVPEKEES
jgi:DNA modification methylase